MAASTAHLRYLTDAVNTASPAQRVVMLYDRMLLDLRRAADCYAAADLFEASSPLRHAQQIVVELRSSLQLDGWDGAENLASVYGFLLTELIALSAAIDPARLLRVEEIVAGLRDSWNAAAQALLIATTGERAERPVSWVS